MNVPLKDQRTEPTSDGHPPEDANMDCVPTALAAMCQGLLGGFYSGDALHDAAYGQGYVGMQDPARFTDQLARYGLRMQRVSGAADALVARAATEIGAGHPVLLAIPSDWNDEPPTSRYAHMVAGCDAPDAATLVAMNPWGGFYQRQSRAWWTERLAHCVYQGIWIVEKVERNQMDNWTDSSDANGVAARDQHGNELRYGQATYVLANKTTANAVAGLAPQAYPFGGDFAVTALEDATALIYGKASNVVSHVTGDAGAVICGLYQQLAQLQQQPPAPGDDAANAAIKALAAALASLR
ncbi:MAG: hypothetical protein OJF49_002231 [Ktedonobacterales bacterium]|nr:MAG: hypothetical protein OJF49_002231 [Ktedonobacterales bacterium]